MQQLKRNGIALCYEEAGKGAPPVVLVHGLAGDHTFMTPQFEHFRRSHRVVLVDLRGHGQSEQPQQEYTIAGFADDLAWLCRELELYKPVLIGHSLGGMIVLDLAAPYPDVPAAIVALDALHRATGGHRCLAATGHAGVADPGLSGGAAPVPGTQFRAH